MNFNFTIAAILMTGCFSGTQDLGSQEYEPIENTSQSNVDQENEDFQPLQLENSESEEQAENSNIFNNEDDNNFIETEPPENITQGVPDNQFKDDRHNFEQTTATSSTNSDSGNGWFGYLNAWSSGEVKKDAKQPWYEKSGETKKNQHFFRKHFSFQNGGHNKNQYRVTRACPVFQEASSQSRIRFKLHKGQMVHAIHKKGGWIQIGDHSYIHELSVKGLVPQEMHSRSN